MDNFVEFGIVFLLTFLLTPIWIRVAKIMDFMDHPGERKIHKHPMPRLGSLAIFFPIIIAFLVQGNLYSNRIFFICSFLLIVVGLLDEKGMIHPQIKLQLAMPFVAVALIASGSLIRIFPWVTANWVVSFFWFVGIIAAFNLIDGMDGLAIGISFIIAIFYSILGLKYNLQGIITFSIPMAAACLGFLPWNLPSARIFLGDSGAMLLGLMVAKMGIDTSLSFSDVSQSVGIPLGFTLLPIFDTTLVFVSRLLRGLPPHSTPGTDHSFHRLWLKGISYKRVVFIMYGIQIMSGLTGLWLATHHTFVNWFILAFYGVIMLLGILYFEKLYRKLLIA